MLGKNIDRVEFEIHHVRYDDTRFTPCGIAAVVVKNIGNDVTVTAFKKAYSRDTLIVRLHNRGSKEATGKLNIATTVKTPVAAYETTLEERRLRQIALSDESVDFTLRPNGLLTLEFEMNNR